MLLAFTVPSIRSAITSFIIQSSVEEGSMTFIASGGDLGDLTLEGNPIEEYVPEGFILKDEFITPYHVVIHYENDKGQGFRFSKMSGGTTSVDADGEITVDVVKGAVDSYLFYENGYSMVYFRDNYYTYLLSSEVESNILIDIANKIIK